MKRVFTVHIFLLLCWSYVVKCTYADCKETAATNITREPTLEPTGDRSSTQYQIKSCIPENPDMGVIWGVKVDSVNLPQEGCNNTIKAKARRYGLRTHSMFLPTESPQVPNCSHICQSWTVDMLYRHCYWVLIKVTRRKDGAELRPLQGLYYVDNDISGPEYFLNSTHFTREVTKKREIAITWRSDRIPFTQYTVEICPLNASSVIIDENGDYHSKEEAYFLEQRCRGEAVNVTGNCTTLGRFAVRCRLGGAGCAWVTLRHDTPWTAGTVFRQHAEVDQIICGWKEAVSAEVSGSAWVWVWVSLGVVVAVGVLLAGVAVALHTRSAHQLKRRALMLWRSMYIDRKTKELSSDDTESPVADCSDPESRVRVCVVYARDCPPVTAVAETLVHMLDVSLPHQVIDLYSPEVADAAAGCEAVWVRALLSDPNTIALVLHAPAMDALYRHPLVKSTLSDQSVPVVEVPLLSACGGAAYRGAFAGAGAAGALVGFALAFITNHALICQYPYRKYYVATIEGISDPNALPLLVPQTRYVLPDAADRLLADMAAPLPAPAAPGGPMAARPPPEPVQVPPRLLEQLQTNCADAAPYIQEHPDYLFKELLYIP